MLLKPPNHATAEFLGTTAPTGCTAGRQRATLQQFYTSSQSLDQQGLFEPPASLESEFRSIPKIDLHCHLSGCARFSTVCEILADQQVELSQHAASDLRSALSFKSPADTYGASFSPWRILNRITQNPEIVGRLVLELAEDFSEDGVLYAEVRVSPRLPLVNGELRVYLQEVHRAITSAREIYHVDLRVILGLTRNIFRHLSPEVQADSVAKIIAAAEPYRNTTVVGFDLWGNEIQHPPRFFSKAFQQFREAGYPLTIHAGETGSPDFIREAIDVLHATRIGHAVLAPEKPEILALIRERGILVEVCLTSNWVTGVVRDIENHPVKKLLAEEIPIALCTDNTLVYKTTLSKEIAKAVWFRLIRSEDIPAIIENSCKKIFGGTATCQQLLEVMSHRSRNRVIENTADALI